MAKQYTINITNGTGTQKVLKDTYAVTANIPGYDNSTLTPTSITVIDNVQTYAFTVAATGTLTVHVSDGAGTNIVGATLQRTNADGTVTYGSVLTTDATGNVTIPNVPYDGAGTAPNVYFKQLSSDGEHEFSPDVYTTNLTTPTSTFEVTNSDPTEKTFTVTDANYNAINVNGTLNLG